MKEYKAFKVEVHDYQGTWNGSNNDSHSLSIDHKYIIKYRYRFFPFIWFDYYEGSVYSQSLFKLIKTIKLYNEEESIAIISKLNNNDV